MNCDEFRRRYDSDPGQRDPELEHHRSGCADCEAYAIAGDEFENRLLRTAQMTVPDGFVDRWLQIPDTAPTEPARRRWLAFAAGVVLTVAGAGGWYLRRSRALADEVSEYIAAWPARAIEASGMGTIDYAALLAPAAIEFHPESVKIQIAKPCVIRGTDAVHLVLAAASGEIAVIVMPRLALLVNTAIRRDELRGTVIPCARGSVAIAAHSVISPAEIADITTSLRYL